MHLKDRLLEECIRATISRLDAYLGEHGLAGALKGRQQCGLEGSPETVLQRLRHSRAQLGRQSALQCSLNRQLGMSASAQ